MRLRNLALVCALAAAASLASAAELKDGKGPAPAIEEIIAFKKGSVLIATIGQKFSMIVKTCNAQNLQIFDWQEGDVSEGDGPNQYRVTPYLNGSFQAQWTFTKEGIHWVGIRLISPRGKARIIFKKVKVMR